MEPVPGGYPTVMTIELTSAQAETIARLAPELGDPVSLHQLTDGSDVYLAPAGGLNRYRIAPDGDAAETADD
jgi:hypothetical protein